MRYFHGGNLREFIEKYSLSSEEIIDFSANTNPLGVPPSVKKVIINNLNCISNYPDPECKELKKEISRYLRINYDNIIIGNGSIELIYLLVRILLPKKALLLIPAFSEYQRALIRHRMPQVAGKIVTETTITAPAGWRCLCCCFTNNSSKFRDTLDVGVD